MASSGSPHRSADRIPHFNHGLGVLGQKVLSCIVVGLNWWHPMFIRDKTILAKAYDPVVEDATCQDKLHLYFVSVERLVV
jgi:hypothetical protein